ncbi:MAG: hydrogenase maturation nickel metallochaperone HypA [Thermoplasmata archaeon]
MHEFSMMTQIVEQVINEACKRGAKEVKETNLEIGEMTFLAPEQLKFAYEILSKGTILENSKLRIRKKKMKILCEKCGYEGKAEYESDLRYHFVVPKLYCPRCKGSVKIVSGKECNVKNIKIVID